MKSRFAILGIIFLALILLAMPFMAACGEEEPTVPVTPSVPVAPTTPTTPVIPPSGPAATPVTPPVVEPVQGEPAYTVMDPRSSVVPIPYVGLAPRLNTLEGKKIGVVNMMGGNEAALTTVAPAIMDAYPGTEAEYIEMKDTKSREVWGFIESCDAIILGNNY